MIEKKIKNNSGYTLLFAVLVSSVVLSVGISILTISKKEFLLSSAARESIVSFYSADSALECAIKNDAEGNIDGINTGLFPCMKNNISKIDALTSGSGLTSTTTFHVKMNDPANTKSCAVVTVAKYLATIGGTSNVPVTSIESRGYNLGWRNNGYCSEESVRRVERAIRYTY